MYTRLLAFIALLLASLLMPLPALLFCALIYAFFWDGYELLVVGIVVDSVFGPTGTSFEYTLSLGSLLIVFAFLRPYISWYNARV
jgi:hypothetical protein